MVDSYLNFWKKLDEPLTVVNRLQRRHAACMRAKPEKKSTF